MAKRPQSFLLFARRLKLVDASFKEFMEAVTAKLPEPNSWQDLRGALRKAGSSDTAIVGARMAWRKFLTADKKKVGN